MTAEVSIIPHVDSVADFKKGMKDWTPKTDAEAGQLIALVSILTSTGGKAAKETAVARLKKKCEKCTVLDFEGFSLKVVEKAERTYKSTKAIAALEKEIEALNAERAKLTAEIDQKIRHKQADLDILMDKREFTEKKVFSHFLVQ